MPGKTGASMTEQRMKACGRPRAIRMNPDWQEKPRSENPRYPYRKPTLVGGGKSPKVNGRTLVKELGNMTP